MKPNLYQIILTPDLRRAARRICEDNRSNERHQVSEREGENHATCRRHKVSSENKA